MEAGCIFACPQLLFAILPIYWLTMFYHAAYFVAGPIVFGPVLMAMQIILWIVWKGSHVIDDKKDAVVDEILQIQQNPVAYSALVRFHLWSSFIHSLYNFLDISNINQVPYVGSKWSDFIYSSWNPFYLVMILQSYGFFTKLPM